MGSIDLSSTDAEWTYRWLVAHLLEQPDEKKLELTWYVAAHFFYREYVQSCRRQNQVPYSLAGLWEVMRILYPHVKDQKLNGTAIFSGVRYISDDVQYFGI